MNALHRTEALADYAAERALLELEKLDEIRLDASCRADEAIDINEWTMAIAERGEELEAIRTDKDERDRERAIGVWILSVRDSLVADEFANLLSGVEA